MVAEKKRVVAKPPLTTDQARRAEIASKIVNGPVFEATHMMVNSNGEPDRFEEWLDHGAYLDSLLGDQSCDVRIYAYYLPIFFWVERELKRFQKLQRAQGKQAGDVRPMIIGFSCPQGGGKTTMTTFLSKLLARSGKGTEIASLDDFYVPYTEQRALADRFAGNRLLEHRGMPGTHDLDLLLDTMDSVRALCEKKTCVEDAVKIPRYNKSAHGGWGDRFEEAKWKTISGDVDVMLLEGWCMGFESLPITDLRDGRLAVVNDVLKDYKEVYKRLDSMLVIEIENMEVVYGWRMEAERAMRAEGKNGLSDEQVRDFVSRFMPAYQHYSPGLYCRQTPLKPGHELHIRIDHLRRPVANVEG